MATMHGGVADIDVTTQQATGIADAGGTSPSGCALGELADRGPEYDT